MTAPPDTPHHAGHEVYVVGGTVRDLLLGGTPKDFDLLTSAEPHQVRSWLGRQRWAGTDGVG